MSTKKIREVLARISENPAAAADPLVQGAYAEIAAIEKAARVLDAEGVSDEVYTVRDRAAGDKDWKGNNWEHPRVVAYGEAAQVITKIAKESK